MKNLILSSGQAMKLLSLVAPTKIGIYGTKYTEWRNFILTIIKNRPRYAILQNTSYIFGQCQILGMFLKLVYFQHICY